MRVRYLVVAAVALPLVVACQPNPTTRSDPTTSAAPTTTSQSPSTPSQEELFREASEVYRGFSDEINRLEAAGGAMALPESLRQYVTGQLEKNLVAVYVESWPQQHKIRTGPAPTIGWIRAYQGTLKPGAVSATIACVDARRSLYRSGTQAPGPGKLQHEILHYKYIGGDLKAFDSGWEDASTC